MDNFKGRFLKPVAHKTCHKLGKLKKASERKTAACFCKKILNLAHFINQF
jgi:hypothetical protein